ncbi:hypothetical protein BU17DRAFT_83109 [Hysterangium stoloniferum]|nr:hypothetical protein BU17DRAFT_83109 [Hysterangium stoloniferum]
MGSKNADSKLEKYFPLVRQYQRDDGLYPNRWYYPSEYHQAAFDTLLSLDDQFLQKRDRIGLNSLTSKVPETPEKPPQHTLRIVLESVILGSPNQMLTFGEICFALRLRFPYYENCNMKQTRWRKTLTRLLPRKFIHVKFDDKHYWKINNELQLRRCKCGDYHGLKESEQSTTYYFTPQSLTTGSESIKMDYSPSSNYLEVFETEGSSSNSILDDSDAEDSEDDCNGGLGSRYSNFPSVPAESIPGGPSGISSRRCILLPPPVDLKFQAR